VANSHSDSLLLAAFLGELFDDPQATLPTLKSMQLEPEMIDEIIDLLSGARLLLATVEREDLILDDRFFNHIAHGLRRPGIVERSRLLADALGDPEPWQHAAMLEITTGVQVALAHPDLLDNPSESLENLLRRRADELTSDPVAKERIALAPTAYVLAHEPEDLVNLVSLIDPPPVGSTVRVAVEPGANHDTYKLNVVCRNRQGLLSRLTGVLADQGISVVAASLATWPDGSVLDSFVVTASAPPAPVTLSALFEHSLAAQPAARRLVAPLPRITLDNSIHPLHSVIRVNGTDQLGLLSAVSYAISAAHIDVHHAVVRTVDGMVDDEFEVSRGDGRKISESDAAAISGSIQLLTHP
jgi:predicted amino acid-binding ACT domain protein